MSLSTALSGFTTISSGSASPSTTSPNCRPSAFKHGDKVVPLSRCLVLLGRHQQAGRETPAAAACRAAGKAARLPSIRSPLAACSGGTCTSSDSAPCGSAKLCSTLRTISAGIIASVSGMRIRSVVPLPGRDSISTLPPIFSTLVRTTSMPTPRPLTFVTGGGGREARQKNQLQQFALAQAVRRVPP